MTRDLELRPTQVRLPDAVFLLLLTYVRITRYPAMLDATAMPLVDGLEDIDEQYHCSKCGDLGGLKDACVLGSAKTAPAQQEYVP